MEDIQATQLEEAEVPWWKQVGSIALPLAATLLMGPAGAYLSTLGGGTGILAALGGGLTSAGAVGSGLGGVAKTLGSIGAKAGYGWLGKQATRGIMDIGVKDTTRAGDISLKGMGVGYESLGREAVKKLRKDFRSAKKDKKLAEEAARSGDIASAILGAVTQQGDLAAMISKLGKTAKGGMPDAAKNKLLKQLTGGPSPIRDLSSVSDLLKTVPMDTSSIGFDPNAFSLTGPDFLAQNIIDTAGNVTAQIPSRQVYGSILDQLIGSYTAPRGKYGRIIRSSR